jgi:hypothetical protein
VRFSFVAYHLALRFSPPFRGPNPFCPPALPAATAKAFSVKHATSPHAKTSCPPLTSLLACRRVTRSSRSVPSALAARGRRLRSVGCARAPWAPSAGSSPSLRRPSRCHLHGVCLQNTVWHCAPFTPPVPRTSTAARRHSSQKCMRSSCVRSRGSASPLRRGAAARQFPPSLCRCAHHPLRGPIRRASHRRFTLHLPSVGPSRYVGFLSSSSVAAHEELKKPPPLLRSPPTVHSAKSLLPHAGCRVCLLSAVG